MSMTAQEILATQDEVKTDHVDVGDGRTIRVRELTSGEQFLFAKLQMQDEDTDANAILVVMGAIDDNGKKLFPKLQSIDNVSNVPARIAVPCAEKILELSGLTDAAIADAEKNSEEADSPSGSDSPESSTDPSTSSPESQPES